MQPYLALAVGLRQAGHQVTLSTSYNYTDWIQSYGVQTHPTAFDMQGFTQGPEAQAVIRSGNFFRGVRLLRDMMRQNSEAQAAV